MKRGKVYLVGAGPGDIGLITVKGLKIIEKADVIVHDFLANRRLFSFARDDVVIIDAGKRGGKHLMSQEEINRLLIEKAKKGKMVVRLKGGDPFIFGRGAEEAEELAKAGVEFELVPGVTSAISVPAYAGIPLTHRRINSTVAFITGHEDPEKEKSSIIWEKLATACDTLVFLMGVKNLPKIVNNLIKYGRKTHTPCAVIRWGTTPSQRTVISSLSEIVEKVKKEGITAPAIFVVGDVVKLREKLNWFEKKPLFGKKIIVTRAREQASEFANLLEEFGAFVIQFPTIKISPPSDPYPLKKAVKNLEQYDWIIFTSVNGVKFFFDTLFEMNKDVRELKGIKLCAIGPGTKDALAKRSLKVDLMPDEYRAEAIAELFEKEDISNKKILIPRAKEARKVLPEMLEKMGAYVDIVEAYQTLAVADDPDKILSLIKENKIDMITFTSSSTVKNFFSILNKEDKEIIKDTSIACIGPITANTLKGFGFSPAIIPEKYTINSMVDAIVKFYQKKE